MFFNNNDSTPGISVFGPVNTTNFKPDPNNTYNLQIGQVQGSGKAFYRAGDVIVYLNGYDWNTPATPPGNVCRANPQAFTPDPDGAVDYFGSFSLQVYAAAALTVTPPTGPPLLSLTLAGKDFAESETVTISIGSPQNDVVSQVTTDANGKFTTTIGVPQLPYNSVLEFFALGQTSAKLAIATATVTPVVRVPTSSIAAGASTAVYGFGFGAAENVSVYLDDPRFLLTTAVADSQGTFKGKITIPTGTTSGPNALLGIGQTTGAIGIGKITIQ